MLETEYLIGLKWRPNPNFGLNRTLWYPILIRDQLKISVSENTRVFSNIESFWRPKFCWSLSETGSGFRSRYLRPATDLVSKDFKFETEIAVGLQNLRPSIMLVSSWDRIMFRSPNLETEIYFGLKWRPLGNFRSPNWKYFETTYFGLWFRSQNLIRDRFWFRSPNSGLNWTGFL